jgi:tRNA-specific 2-thiouridylase
MENVKGKKIFVGLSGGVDSAVTAALLKKGGAVVTGVFIKGWYPPGMPCTWADDRRDAMRVAASLRIPFYTLDASEEYKRGVIDYLISEYAAGRTPNPDSMCNKEVKFGAFYDFARKHNADYIATGHYAQNNFKKNTISNSSLYRGLDSSKDQSYFLWAIPKKTLEHTLFPLGEIQKSEVRKLAKRFKLPVAEKKDSQGICFLGSISVDDFLKKEFDPKAGKAVTFDGNEVGMHDGAVLYTLGTRVPLYATDQPGPWYVVAKNIHTNTLTVAKHQVTDLPVHTILLREANWFTNPHHETLYGAQYRYHGPIIYGKYNAEKNMFSPLEPLHEPIAAGQSLVLYENDACIGGGIIV